MIVIGLSGKASSGKGSVVQLAQILMQKGDDEKEVRAVSFAAALKQTAADLVAKRIDYFDLGLPVGVADELWRLGRELTAQDLKQKTPQARTFLQFLGTEAMRKNVDDLYWVKRAAEKINALPSETQIVFVPDCRFTNEADYIRNMGGQVWRIERYVKQTGGYIYDPAIGEDGAWVFRGPLVKADPPQPFDNKLTPEQKAHPSETQLDDYAFDVVLKASDMDELFHSVEAELKKQGLLK